MNFGVSELLTPFAQFTCDNICICILSFHCFRHFYNNQSKNPFQNLFLALKGQSRWTSTIDFSIICYSRKKGTNGPISINNISTRNNGLISLCRRSRSDSSSFSRTCTGWFKQAEKPAEHSSDLFQNSNLKARSQVRENQTPERRENRTFKGWARGPKAYQFIGRSL